MMNDPLRRKMFREAGMSKQPMGILASSPELMNATQSPGYSHGGLHKANWMNNDNIYSPNLISYKNKALSVGKDVIGTETPPTKSELEQLAEMKRQETIKDLQLVPDGSATNFGVDTSGEQTGPILAGEAINKTSETILNNEKYRLNKSLGDKEVTNNEIISSNKPRNDGGTSDSTSISSSFKNQLTKVNEEKKAAVTAMATGMSDANQYLMGGKTYTQHLGEYTSLLNNKGVEPTLADIKNDAMNLLQFDPATLDKEYDEDKQASMWLNMMKAGLAIASGESPNALTNIAKGFAYGLDSYGKDLGSLKKDLRADKKDATNTMYKLLNDKKSEVLAKRMLNIKEKEGLLNIQKYVGEQKTKAIEAYKMKMDNAKWNVTVLGTIAKMDLDTQKYAFDKENLEKTYKLAVANATPKE
jgi:hypothetical protein